MPLQNRVDPFGLIRAAPERGSLMGNRGIIHDPLTRTLLRKRWTSKAWIICLCKIKGRRRRVMGPGSYTELFFLDEATALAAGHRPCFECQRQRAKSFAAAFAAGCGLTSINASDMDARLHRERSAAGNAVRAVASDKIRSLPSGCMVSSDDQAFLVTDEGIRAWFFGGYGPCFPFDQLQGRPKSLLTPASTVSALRAGYTARTVVGRTT